MQDLKHGVQHSQRDPESVSIEDLRKLPTMKEVLEYTKTNYPNWIVGFADRYSDDYPHLTCTWVEMAKMLKTEPSQIMLVSYVPERLNLKQHPVLSAICDIFSRGGFMIRYGEDFQPCTECQALLPTKKTYTKLSVQPPFEWRSICRLCAESKKPVIEELDEVD